MSWPVLSPDRESVLGRCPDPMRALADGEIGGVVIKGAYRPEDCAVLVRRFIAEDLIPDPADPDRVFAGDYQTVGHFRSDDGANRPLRIDIGSSLVNHTRLNPDSGDKDANKDRFLAHSEETQALFARLFEGIADPVDCLYQTLSGLAPGKEVKTAYEPDGRGYGPAIFRVHYPGQAYTPHINHVRVGDRLDEFNVSRYAHQFAGLICFQHSADLETTPHAEVHRTEWTPEVRRHLTAGTYRDFLRDHAVPQCTIAVEPGDFYLFNSGLMHEVGPVVGDAARIVLATFISYSPNDDEVMVWA